MFNVDAISRTIGERTAQLRRSRGMTLQVVADRAGLVKSYVWEIENGRGKRPSIETTASLAAVFGVSLDYITGLSTGEGNLHPEAMRIACEIDALLRREPVSDQIIPEPQTTQDTPK